MWCGDEAIQAEQPETTFDKDFLETREVSAVLQTASKNYNVGMHSDIYESAGFKLGVMIDVFLLYILILV